MENEELIKLCTEKAQGWLTPAYDAETQAEVKLLIRTCLSMRSIRTWNSVLAVCAASWVQALTV